LISLVTMCQPFLSPGGNVMRTATTNWTKSLFLVGVGMAIGVAVPGAQPSSAKEVKRVEPPRIGYVSSSRAIRGFTWANEEGAKITKRRSLAAEEVSAKQDLLAKIKRDQDESTDSLIRTRLAVKAVELKRSVE